MRRGGITKLIKNTHLMGRASQSHFSGEQPLQKYTTADKMRDLVESHHPIASFSERLGILSQAVQGAIKDPTQGGLVSEVGEVTGEYALTLMHDRMLADPVGKRILEDKPRLREPFFNWKDLEALPKDTFGYHYFTFMTAHQFTPEGRPVAKYIQDPVLAYIFQRYKEIHDFTHILMNYDTSVMEELGLKWFEMIQTGMPVASLSALLGFVTLSPSELPKFYSVYVPHATKNAGKGKFMMNVYYEEMLDKPIDEVRKELGYEPFPQRPSA